MASGARGARAVESEQAETRAARACGATRAAVGAVEKEYEFDTERRQEDARRAVRRPLAAARVQHDVWGPTTRSEPAGLHEPGRRARRHGRASEPSRRDADVHLARADRPPDRLQAADGLAIPVRLDATGATSRGTSGSRSRPSRPQAIPAIKAMVDDPPEWLREWARADRREARGRDARGPAAGSSFAREGETVYHTYTVTAPDPFVAPYHSFLLKRTAKDEPAAMRAWRKDEYPPQVAG